MKEKFEQHTLNLGEGQVERLRKISTNKGASLDMQVRTALEVYCEIIEGDTINRAWQNVKAANERITDLQEQLFKAKEELQQVKVQLPISPTHH